LELLQIKPLVKESFAQKRNLIHFKEWLHDPKIFKGFIDLVRKELRKKLFRETKVAKKNCKTFGDNTWNSQIEKDFIRIKPKVIVFVLWLTPHA
jgi:hypothetical protein